MLSEEEEQRLLAIINLTHDEVSREVEDSDISPSSICWLADKLLEKNNELSQVHAELQKTNEELARVWEVYGP